MYRIGCLIPAVRSAANLAFGEEAAGEKPAVGEVEVVWGRLRGVEGKSFRNLSVYGVLCLTEVDASDHEFWRGSALESVDSRL